MPRVREGRRLLHLPPAQPAAIDDDVLMTQVFLQAAARIPESEWRRQMKKPFEFFVRRCVRGVMGEPDHRLVGRLSQLARLRNQHGEHPFTDVDKVVLCEEGVSEEDDWRLIGRCHPARGCQGVGAWFIFSANSCYTGFDCNPLMGCIAATGLERFVQHALGDSERRELAGLARSDERLVNACVAIQAHFRGWRCRMRTAVDPHQALGALPIRRQFTALVDGAPLT